MSRHGRRREGSDPPAGGEAVDDLVAAGMERYRRGDLSGARAAGERAQQADPADPRAGEYLEHMDNVVELGEPLATRDGGAGDEAGDADLDDALTVERPGVRMPDLEPELELELMPAHDVGDDDATRERFPPSGGSASPRERETADLPRPEVALELELGESPDVDQAEGSSLAEVLSGVAEALRREDAGEEDPDGIRARLLEELERDASSGESPADAAARRIDALAVVVGRELDAGRATPAVVAANLAMDEQPESAAAQKRLHEHAKTLLRAYERFLGDSRGVPLVALPLHELPTQKIDSRAAFLLSRVDGMLSFDEILDVSGMPRLEACSYLARLVLQGIIDVR